ncbi:SUMF1/EgtB/PvdO family nonheme iron enzyme [Accumulibacter sp.]|uniref:SUMF1/EgtB/PvdO family nonheme iron enzyme n=1 Tax=Accumulibacter sp. TaxID=2053492 RepID=UPI0025D1252C|nr:SUMF1/EgtB/PvdO family nonheme iron enzyme [Accumulibacter sp.]MCM8611924.1 SUMF1/EgtB/PvdO family nonheme iron enzyme [Accumulibacter sp.]MCM8635546.1 SUMF1/EgtB/PvdO family nonheme iron enzyme [Accumulibacter sp.]MCM8639124.1 SUMF1/EgtB/PvdO family nonheme iron enzyme [Accumulibacter sp.]
MSPRGLAGRSDLLRAAVAVHGAQAVGSDEAIAAALAPLARLLALHPQPQRAERSDLPVDERQQAAAASGRSGSGAPASAASRRLPLSAAHFALVEYRVEAAATPPHSQPLPPLTRLDCQPRRSGSAPHSPLVGRTRLWPALQRALASPRRGPLDVPALVGELSRARSPQRLPRRLLRRWGGEMDVVVDVAQRLVPYDADYRELLGEVRRRHGEGGLRLWVVDDSPFTARAVAAPGCASPPAAAGPIPLPPPATRVLILGDLGLLAGDPARAAAWQEFTRRLAAHGALPVAWLPMSPALVPAEALRHAALHCLDGAHGLRALRARNAGTATAPVSPPVAPSGDAPIGAAARHPLLPALLTRLACCVRVEPGLLRALRRIDADTAAEPGLEAIAWSYAPAVAAGSRFCELSPAGVADYRDRFSGLAAAEQQEILRRILDAHAWRGRATESAELLIWQAHARPEAAGEEFGGRLGEARDWFARFGAAAAETVGDAAGYAGDLFDRHGGDRAWIEANSSLLAPIWALAGVDDIPDGLRPADVAAARRRAGSEAVASRWRLRQQDDRFVLLPDRGEELAGRWPALTLEGGAVCSLRGDAGSRQRWIEARAAPLTLPLADAAQLSAIALDSGRRHHRLARLQRPPWAKELGRDSHGLYLDVELNGVVQRFRWIDPGEFLMGSPGDEPGREENEGPRHRVRLTQGFWLADTACTQALWRAVMGGSNPSAFQDDARNPVENVSWDDTSAFLQRVSSLVPGVVAELPTEAEWEYACRAGSETPFSFGTTITPEQANYDGNYPYAGGEKGVDRQKTVPVKSFAPTRWGLYEMHGNVWEWCVDGKRAYDGSDEENPRGPEDVGEWRVVRGGSWDDGAVGLRSACRDEWHRAIRLGPLGFRFALRSIGQEQAAGAERPQQDFNPAGPEAPPGLAAFPGREGSVAASADAEAATGGRGKLAKATPKRSRKQTKK